MMKGDNAYVDLGFGFEGCEIKRREKISELGRKGCSEIGGYRRCVQNRWSWTRGKARFLFCICFFSTMSMPRMLSNRAFLQGVRVFSSKSKVIDTSLIVKSLVANGVPAEQAETAVKSIDNDLECFVEKVLADFKKPKEYHTDEFNKLKLEMEILQNTIKSMQADQNKQYMTDMNNVEEKFLKSPSDLETNFNKLKRHFEKAKFLGANFAIYTLAATAVVGGFGAFLLLMKDIL